MGGKGGIMYLIVMMMIIGHGEAGQGQTSGTYDGGFRGGY